MIILIRYIIKKSMMKILKKNQIVIFAIALMLITAGYLNYSMNTEQIAETSALGEQSEYAGIGDAKLVSSTDINNNEESESSSKTNEYEDEEIPKASNTTQNNVDTQENTNNEKNNNSINITETSSKESQDLNAYFDESRLQREKMYSEMLATNQSILSEQNISAEQKKVAQNEIININKQKNAIMIAENLIKNKGFRDIVIFVNNEMNRLNTPNLNIVEPVIKKENFITGEKKAK